MEPVEESAAAGLTGVENAMASRATMRTWTAGGGVAAAGVVLALLGAPCAAADPELPPADPPAPLAMVAPAPALPADGVAAAPTGVVPAAVPTDAAAPLSGVSHLPTPDSLPPGTTAAPTEGRKLGYIRDLWHAVRTQDVTMSDALLLFAQRPMDANAPLAAMSPHNDPVVIDGAVVPPPAAEAPVADTAAPATAP